MDQIIIGDLASYDDFGASVATRRIKPPKKKSIKETVPYSNAVYDFSDIDGETYWEERELEYTLEITADTPEELEAAKRRFTSWVLGAKKQKLHDPHIPDHHFLATYESMDVDDDEGLDKTTLTVTFLAYPYMLTNVPKVYETTLTHPSEEWLFQALNESDHPVALTITNTGHITIKVGEALTVGLTPGEGTYGAIKLPVGFTDVAVRCTTFTGADCAVRISFHEEVF